MNEPGFILKCAPSFRALSLLISRSPRKIAALPQSISCHYAHLWMGRGHGFQSKRREIFIGYGFDDEKRRWLE